MITNKEGINTLISTSAVPLVTVLWLSSGLRGEKPAPNCLSYATAIWGRFTALAFVWAVRQNV
jgi:hypothetical protein